MNPFSDEEDLETVWEFLFAWRDQNPEGVPANDDKWGDVCAAMARIREGLGLPDEVDT